MTPTMAALVGGAGPDWEVRHVDVPTAGPGQLLVRVRAAGLNRADLSMLAGTYNAGATRRDTFTAGLELAGEVKAIGPGVDNIGVGDRVMGTTLGAFASLALVDHRHVVAVPGPLGWTDAAALPIGLTTEHDALVTQGRFTAGQRVLVVGATSGVGMIAVQLAKALGAALVVATTTSDAKAQALTAVGADVVVNTTSEDIAEIVNRATGGAGVDIVLDHVGGDLFAELFAATRIRGIIVNIGRLAGPRSTINLDQLSFRRLRVQGTTFSIRTAEERGEVAAALVPVVLPAVADGRIRPVVDSVFPFEEAQRAADRMRSNQAVGKIVIEMPSTDAYEEDR
jgi:NADPH2:quinone reductase